MAVNHFAYLVSWSACNQLSARPPGENENAQIPPEMSFNNFEVGKKEMHFL